MILCKQCNAVRASDSAPCDNCGTYMTVAERAAASLNIPERQFFDNVLACLDEARRQFPKNTNLVHGIRQHADALETCSSPTLFRMELIAIAVLVLRLAVQGDQAYKLSLVLNDDLSDLETKLKGL